MAKTNIVNADLLLALSSRKRRGNAATVVKGNRDAKIVTTLTTAHEQGIARLQGEKLLDGWTRVHKGRVVSDVTPAMVAGIIGGRANREMEKASNGIEHDADYLGITVIPSEGSKPSRDARLGGRFYVLDVQKLDAIEEAEYANLIEDVDNDVRLMLTGVRPLASSDE